MCDGNENNSLRIHEAFRAYFALPGMKIRRDLNINSQCLPTYAHGPTYEVSYLSTSGSSSTCHQDNGDKSGKLACFYLLDGRLQLSSSLLLDRLSD